MSCFIPTTGVLVPPNHACKVADAVVCAGAGDVVRLALKATTAQHVVMGH
jgi:hypothetical protein